MEAVDGERWWEEVVGCAGERWWEVVVVRAGCSERWWEVCGLRYLLITCD